MYKLIDGKKISENIFDELKKEIATLKNDGKNITLAIIQVGNDEAGLIYLNAKIKKCSSVGIDTVPYRLNEETTTDELKTLILKLNEDNNINGIFIEMPLPKHIDVNQITDAIDYKKDVDGINKKNLGALLNNEKCFAPCTANGIIEILKKSDIKLEGKHCVIIGRSNVVGKPLALLLLRENATVTICHSKTENLKQITNKADILIVAINQKRKIDETYVKEGAVVIDVGIHTEYVDGVKKICGDVDFDKVKNKCSYITPVPGGVGPMTVTMLLKNCVNTVLDI